METKKVLSATIKLTENKFEYILITLEDETKGTAIWPNELEQMLNQDEAIAMSMLGLEKFCLVLKGSKIDYEKEGEGDDEMIVIKSIAIEDRLGIIAKSVEAFIQKMLD